MLDLPPPWTSTSTKKVSQVSLMNELRLHDLRHMNYDRGRHVIGQRSRARNWRLHLRLGKLNSENEKCLVSFHANKAMSRDITYAMLLDEESIAAQQQ
ncbi:hypothetical protein E4U44_000114 [Claviceps purpurea]|nr:hypothetical protein E4U26_004980 [Claviceps purpurea]KAG6324782.1 hypothetical protein E4U44_000114 [Claviceps purpurea]